MYYDLLECTYNTSIGIRYIYQWNGKMEAYMYMMHFLAPFAPFLFFFFLCLLDGYVGTGWIFVAFFWGGGGFRRL